MDDPKNYTYTFSTHLENSIIFLNSHVEINAFKHSSDPLGRFQLYKPFLDKKNLSIWIKQIFQF